MPLHPESQQLLDLIAENEDPAGERTPEALRVLAAGVTEMLRPGPELAAVRDIAIPVTDATIGARVYEPSTERPAGTIVYLHGGGWVVGGIDTHDPLCRVLADASGCRLASIDYRVAPEHPFPTPLEDSFAALAWVAENLAEDSLVIAGDSSGGNLAAACALRARDEGGPEVALQVLLYPVLDHDVESGSYTTYADGYILTREDMIWFWDQYAPDPTVRGRQELSPLRAASLSGLPPAYIAVAEYDPLRDEALAYARRLEAAGIPVTLDHKEDQMHGFGHMIGLLTGTEPAMRRIGQFVSDALGLQHELEAQ